MDEKYNANIGQRFGRLTIVSGLSKSEWPKQDRGRYCVANCDCGGTKVVHLSSVLRGSTSSCGCLKRKVKRSIVGQRYGEVQVVEELGRTTNLKGKAGWLVKLRCDCGAERTAHKYLVVAGKVLICAKHHGLCRSRTSNIWRHMVRRCTNPESPDYALYGGRGIKVSDDWLNFAIFLKDMGKCPEGKSLDRIDNNQGYSKKNCRWATTKEQNRNKRTNVFLEHEGKRLCVSDWAALKNLKAETIKRRIKAGWPINLILESNESGLYGKLLFTEKDKRLNLWYRWRMMIKRCADKNHESYHRYGGRGIKVCAQWVESFDCFLRDVGYPEIGQSLDRIDNDGNYEPKNVRWANTKEQSSNKSSNVHLKIGKKTKTISEWSKITGVAHSLIRRRLAAGWLPEKAIGFVDYRRRGSSPA